MKSVLITLVLFLTILVQAEVPEDLITVGVDSSGQEFQLEDEPFYIPDKQPDDSGVSQGFEGTMRSMRKVLGEDSRTQVRNPTGVYRMIGQLVYKKSGTTRSGTGMLVGPRHVLTAGHCIYDIRTDSWATDVRFYPGRMSKKSIPHGVYSYSKLLAVTGWTKKHKREYDFGMVVLSDNAGKELGWLGFGYNNNNDKFKGYKFNVAGYPGDKPSGTMWRAFGKVNTVSSQIFTHLCDTYSGMSGAPMYVFNSKQDSRIIYGVHTAGTKSYNRAKRLDKITFDKLKSWKQTY